MSHTCSAAIYLMCKNLDVMIGNPLPLFRITYWTAMVLITTTLTLSFNFHQVRIKIIEKSNRVRFKVVLKTLVVVKKLPRVRALVAFVVHN